MRKIDLTGDRYGDWLVIKESDVRKNKKIYWECQCLLCGKISLCSGNNLRTGKTKHCGCKLPEIRSAMHLHDLTGKQFGMLTVLERAKDAETYGRTMWKCRCACGTVTTVAGIHLESGSTSSCGCCRTSKGELKISELLQNAGIPFIPHYYVNIDGNRYFYDFFIDNKYFVEFDGIQHYVGWDRNQESLEWQINQDNIKNQYCIDNNIALIRIPYTLLDSLSIDNLLLSEGTTDV